MTNYSSIITKLYEQAKVVQSNSDRNCFSLYLPLDAYSQARSKPESLDMQLKSLVEQAISQFLPEPEQKELRLELEKQLSSLSKLIDYDKAGVCLYATFNKLDRQYRGGRDKNASSSEKETLLPFTQIVPLFTLPSKNPSASIGQAFDLIPMLDNLYFATSQLVLDLHEENSRLYDFGQMQLRPIESIQNSFEKFPSREEYLDQTATTHSNRKDFNYDSDYLHQYMKNDIMPVIQRHKNQYKSIMIVGSDKYLQQIKGFIESLKSNFVEVKTLSFVTDQGNETMENLLAENSQQEIKNLRENPVCYQKNSDTKFETNLTKIVTASAKGQIKTLYIKPQYRPNGFMIESDPDLFAKFMDPQTGQKENIELHKITPLLIQQVIEMGGQVVPITAVDNFQSEEYGPLVASLRY